MAIQVISQEIATCDRCAFGKEEPIEENRVFALEDRYYELDLCPQHAAMFDRDMNGWVRLAAEISSPYESAPQLAVQSSTFMGRDPLEEARRLRELRAKEQAKEQAAVDREKALLAHRSRMSEEHARKAIPGAAGWKLSIHAYQRLVQRGISVYEVLETAAQPEQTYYQPWRGEFVAIHQRAHCRIVVDEETKTVVTVIDRNKELESDPRELAHARLLERKAQ